MKLRVTNEMEIRELNDSDIQTLARPKLRVDSHWESSELVVLDFAGVRVTVSVAELEVAVANASRRRK
jgi:hypothetical protein